MNPNPLLPFMMGPVQGGVLTGLREILSLYGFRLAGSMSGKTQRSTLPVPDMSDDSAENLSE